MYDVLSCPSDSNNIFVNLFLYLLSLIIFIASFIPALIFVIPPAFILNIVSSNLFLLLVSTFNKGVNLLASELNVIIDNLSFSFKLSIINSNVSLINSNLLFPYMLPLTSIIAIKSVGDLLYSLLFGLFIVIVVGTNLGIKF